MPTISIGQGRRDQFSGDRRQHSEEEMFASSRVPVGDFACSMDAWPCMDGGRHNCHDLFKRRSAGRTITLTVTGDSGGYAVNHEDKADGNNTITYDNGDVAYSTV